MTEGFSLHRAKDVGSALSIDAGGTAILNSKETAKIVLPIR